MTAQPRSIALLCLLSVALLAGCASAPSQPERRANADELYEGQPRAVFGTEFPPGSAPEAAARGDAALARRDYDRALYFYVEAVSLDPTDITTLLKIGAIHREHGRHRLALGAYRRVLEQQSAEAVALEGAGLALLELREIDAAQELLSRAVAADETRWRAHEALGVITDLEQHPGWHATALQHYERALALTSSPSIYNNLGYSDYLAGDFVAAESAFRETVALDPEFARGWRNLALVYVKLERYEDAVAALHHVGKPAAALNDVGYLAMLEGRYAVAEEYLTRATEASPGYYRTAYENLDRVRELRSSVRVVGAPAAAPQR